MRIASLVALLFTAAAIPQDPPPALTAQQVMRLRQVTAVVPSSDGSQLAYIVSGDRGADEPSGGSRREAFVMPTAGGEARPIAGSTGIAWRPGTDVVCYVAQRDGDSAPQVYGTSLRSGTEQRITDTPNGVADFAWRPDGAALAYTSRDPLPDAKAANLRRGFAPIVVDEDVRHVSLWLWEPAGVRRLTEGATVRDWSWAPTGTHLAVAMSRTNSVDDGYMFTRLFVVVPDGGKVERLVDNPGKLGSFAWSPDGERLAFIGAADRNDPHAGMLFICDRGSQAVIGLTEGLRGAVRDVDWIDNTKLRVLYDIGVRSFVAVLPIDGGKLPRDDALPVPASHAFAKLGSSGRIALTGSTATHPDELFVEESDGSFRRVTVTNPWLDEVTLAAQQVVRVSASDGVEIEGLRLLPVGHEDGDRHPLVIVAHGGPESHYQDGWLTRYAEPGQVLAGMGYVVWYPNYRASTGYGVAFAKADHGDPMGREFRDHLDAIAAFDAAGLIDKDRVGVIGGSYGGYTAAWAATRHSEQFAAAVSFVPFVDIRTKWLTSDIPWEFYLVHYQELWPHEQPGFLADRSPLTWAEHCRTPLLVCGGDADPRVDPSQPFMLYRAVRFATDTPCRYVRYPGEGHGNRTNVYRYDYLLRSIRWLDHYLREPDRRDAPMPPAELEYPKW